MPSGGRTAMVRKLVQECRMRQMRIKVLWQKSGANFWNLPKAFVRLVEAM
jgi:hypothetical protein